MSTATRWRIAIVFEVDAENDEDAYEVGDKMVPDLGDRNNATYLGVDTDDRLREHLGQVS